MRQISRLTQESTFSKTGRWCQNTNPEKETPPLILIVIYLYTVKYTLLVAGMGAGRWWFMALYCQLEGMVSFISDLPMSSHSYQSPISQGCSFISFMVNHQFLPACVYQHNLSPEQAWCNVLGKSLCLQAVQHWSFKIQPLQRLWLLLCPPSLLLPKLPFTFWTVDSHVDAKHYYMIMICKSGLIILLLFVARSLSLWLWKWSGRHFW